MQLQLQHPGSITNVHLKMVCFINIIIKGDCGIHEINTEYAWPLCFVRIYGYLEISEFYI